MQNRNVSVIPARVQNRVTESGKSRAKLRVAAYCRVSTDDEEQLTSYEAQVGHYSNHIQQNPEWEFAGIYAEMKIAEMIQFENMNPARKARNKSF